ncbi:MAG: hypothetical protein HYU66_16530 [Armatimonadetes bacterium]|nr:hypothetical protein [Armatimonadota bacterium]
MVFLLLLAGMLAAVVLAVRDQRQVAAFDKQYAGMLERLGKAINAAIQDRAALPDYQAEAAKVLAELKAMPMCRNETRMILRQRLGGMLIAHEEMCKNDPLEAGSSQKLADIGNTLTELNQCVAQGIPFPEE